MDRAEVVEVESESDDDSFMALFAPRTSLQSHGSYRKPQYTETGRYIIIPR